jgi:hypothetical protein
MAGSGREAPCVRGPTADIRSLLTHDVASRRLRENRVNQSGSVALSTEAMRGPPLAQLIDKNGISDSKVRATNQGVVGSNPAGRANQTKG